MVFVVKVHIDGANIHDRPGDLCPEVKCDPFIRLHMDNEPVGPQPLNSCLAEEDEGCLFKLDNDGRITRRHSLAGADIKRYVCPTPVVDAKLEGCVGISIRSW